MNTSESGNILIYIFIAVGLLGALSYTVARTGQVNMQSIGKEKATTDAIEIVSYANTVVGAVSKLRLRGYKEQELSFQKDEDDDEYENSNCTELGCRVFDKTGGSVNYQAPQKSWLNKEFEDEDYYGAYYFTASSAVSEIGGNDPDVIMFLPYLKKVICAAINKRLSIEPSDDETPVQSDDVYAMDEAFTGYFDTAADFQISGNATSGTDDEILHGKAAGCVRVSGSDNYVFYQVLMAR